MLAPYLCAVGQKLDILAVEAEDHENSSTPQGELLLHTLQDLAKVVDVGNDFTFGDSEGVGFICHRRHSESVEQSLGRRDRPGRQTTNDVLKD